VGNSQNGNNNAYCQDNEIGWVDWSRLEQEGEDMTQLLGRLSELRHRFPQLSPRRWVEGKRPDGSYGVLWLTPQGTEMTEQDWKFPEGRFLAYVLEGVADGAALLIVMNAGADPIEFKVPEWPRCRGWKGLIDTSVVRGVAGGDVIAVGQIAKAPACSVLVFEGAQ
jgi:isoamylase